MGSTTSANGPSSWSAFDAARQCNSIIGFGPGGEGSGARPPQVALYQLHAFGL